MKIKARLLPVSFVWLVPVTHEPRIVTGGVKVVADRVLDQPVVLRAAALSRALTLKEYEVLGVSPDASYVGLDCQALLKSPSVVHSK